MLNEFILAYKEDKPLKVIYESLLNGECHSRYRLYKSLIVTREDKLRVYIPDNAKLRMRLFTEAHNTPLAGHPGFHKMYSYIRRHFVRPRIREDILDFVRSCPECQTTKPRHDKPYGVIMPIEPPQEPWSDISMDLITGLTKSNNCTAILVVVDRFSKMAHFIPINTDIDAIKLAEVFVNNIVRLHGIPKSIISDRDPRFVSAFWKELFTNIDTNLRFSTANHPQTDGQTERTNRTLEQYLRLYAKHRPNQWTKYISFAEIAYNNAIHSSTGVSPFYLVYQLHMNIPFDLTIGDIHNKNAATESLMNDHRIVLQQARESLMQTQATNDSL